MARFRDVGVSTGTDGAAVPVMLQAPPQAQGPVQIPVDRRAASEVQDAVGTSVDRRDSPPLDEGRMGELLARYRQLTPQQVERIATVARLRRVRFGDAAVALGLASAQDVFQALASQFRYACAAQAPGLEKAEQLMLHRPRSPQAEAVRALRSELSRQVFRDGEPAASLAVVSPQSQDGKSFLSANLAVAWSQAGRRTLLVDADLRGPRQHQVFGIGAGAGLSSLLSGRAGMEVIAQIQDVPGLYVLPAGPLPPNPLELVDGPVFRDLMRDLSDRFDQIVVDTPACAYGADALAIADRCTAALVVARRDASRLAALASLTGRLSQGPARLAGVVMNSH